jgi:hypothetical protein
MKRKLASTCLNKPTYLSKRPNADLLWKLALLDEPVSENPVWYVPLLTWSIFYNSENTSAFTENYFKFGLKEHQEMESGNKSDLEKSLEEFSNNEHLKNFKVFSISLQIGDGHRTVLIASAMDRKIVRFDSHDQPCELAILFDQSMSNIYFYYFLMFALVIIGILHLVLVGYILMLDVVFDDACVVSYVVLAINTTLYQRYSTIIIIPNSFQNKCAQI